MFRIYEPEDNTQGYNSKNLDWKAKALKDQVVKLSDFRLKTLNDFLIKLGIKPLMHL